MPGSWLLAIVGTLLLALVPSSSVAGDVPQWSTCDVNLTATGSSPNWYTDPGGIVTATFTGPGGIAKIVHGFWNGGNAFTIRFTPTVEGTWSYATSSPNPGLNGKTGSIHATAPKVGDHGFLRVDPKYNYSFVWDDGTRCFLWGQTYDDIAMTAMVNDNWRAAPDNCRRYGFNMIRMNVYTDYDEGARTHHGYPDAQPYTYPASNNDSPDRDSLNLAYWRKLDDVVRYLNSQGMVAQLCVWNPYRHNRAFGTEAQNDRYVRYVAARYGAFPRLMWNLSWEWDSSLAQKGDHPQTQADFDRMGQLLRDSDPWMTQGAALRPLSIHGSPAGRNFAKFWGKATWPTYESLQYRAKDGPYKFGDQWGNDGILRNLGHEMPVVNDEYGYLMDIWSGTLTMDRTNNRSCMWGIAVAGAYATCGDWRQQTDGKNTWFAVESGEWVDAPEYGDVKRLVEFFTTKGIEYWKMSSQNSLTPTARTYVLAEPGRQYVVYAAAGGTLSVKLAVGNYHVLRYDPRTGASTDLGPIAGDADRRFAMPDSNDWVVHISTRR